MRRSTRSARLLVATALVAGLAAAQSSDDPAPGERGRAELAAIVARALESAPAAPASALEPGDAIPGIALHAVAGPGMRVLAASGEEEARSIARALAASQALFAELTGQIQDYPGGRAFAVEKAQRDALLASFAVLTEEQRSRLARLEGSGIEGTPDWGFWALDAEQRLDGMVRLSIDWMLSRLGVTLAQAWLHEGLGIHLTHALVGTQSTWFVPPRLSGTKDEARNVELAQRLQEPDCDWLAEARSLFAPRSKLDLEEVLHLTADEMDPSDHLAARALVAYVVEVRREALPAVLEGVGRGQDPREVLEEALGCTFQDLRTRIGPWLEARSAAVARASGRRSEAELTALWKKLDAAGKKAAIEGFRTRAATLETEQMRTLRAILGSSASETAAAAGELDYYDPKVHAPGDPIPRKRLAASDGRVKKTLRELRKERKASDAPAPALAHDFDWGSGKVVRRGEPLAAEAVFQNALLGLPPDADLARALVLQALDRADERKLHEAFGHAYTDRDGNVYPLTLYEAWLSGKVLEMPDIDVLGIVHDVLDEWQKWKAPLAAADHTAVYTLVGQLFKRCRGSREMREVLADLFLAPTSRRPDYASLDIDLHVLWAEAQSSPEKLAAVLPDGRQRDDYLNALVERCKSDPAAFASGRKRAAALRMDVARLHAALGEALEAARADGAGRGAGR